MTMENLIVEAADAIVQDIMNLVHLAESVEIDATQSSSLEQLFARIQQRPDAWTAHTHHQLRQGAIRPVVAQQNLILGSDTFATWRASAYEIDRRVLQTVDTKLHYLVSSVSAIGTRDEFEQAQTGAVRFAEIVETTSSDELWELLGG